MPDNSLNLAGKARPTKSVAGNRARRFQHFILLHRIPVFDHNPSSFILQLARSIISAFLIAILAACNTSPPPPYQQQSYVFGTLVEISIAGESDERAAKLAAQVMREFERLHHKLHAWKPGELSALNASFAKQQPPVPVAVDTEIALILQDAGRLSAQSGGLFNPAIGKLVKLWGFHADDFQPALPDAGEIAKLAAANPQMRDLVIDGGKIHSKNPAVQLDLGGYAKGYALDLAAAYLRKEGVNSALVNIGGNVIAIGKNGARAWRVGIQHPRKPAAIATLELQDGEAIGTSGDYQRYFEVAGKRYCHLIDPRSGYPVNGVQAVTVVMPPAANAGTLSDVASKPLFVAGVKDWQDAARTMRVELAMLIDSDNNVHLTEAMKKRLVVLESR